VLSRLCAYSLLIGLGLGLICIAPGRVAASGTQRVVSRRLTFFLFLKELLAKLILIFYFLYDRAQVSVASLAADYLSEFAPEVPLAIVIVCYESHYLFCKMILV